MNQTLIRNTLYTLSAFVLILVVIYLAKPNEFASSEEANPNDKAESFFRNQSEDEGYTIDPYYLEGAKTLFSADGDFLKFEQIISRAKTGELNLVSELWTLRRQCPEGSTREQCHEYIKAFLKNEYSEADANRLIQMLTNYLKYESAMVDLDTTSNSFSNYEKYEKVKELRRKIFSKEDANLIFGLEEATADFSFNRKNFLDETKNLSADERIRQYDAFRKKSFGNYYNALVAREPKFDRFETEMELRQQELSKLSPKDRENKEKEIRISYFGKDGNERMEKVLREIKEEEEKISRLEQEEKKFLNQNPNLSATDREKKLMEMRSEILGSKELAEEYSRRIEYERTLKNQSD